MESASHLREILAADLALSMGLASAEQVADALQRRIESGDESRTGLASDLRSRELIDGEAATRLERAVEDLLKDAQGDARLAVARRGGLDGSIHTSLPAGLSRTLKQEGAAARPPLRQIAEGRYRDFKVAGKGGMGIVYLAHDTELNRDVAFKMVLPTPGASRDTPAPATPLEATPPPDTDEDSARSFDEFRVRFLQEAWVTGAMEHPGVVPVYELGETTSGIPYYTMRYVTGERSLKDAIAEVEDVDDRLGLLEPFLKVCDTIRYAHARGIVHRDLKPENIGLGDFGEVIVLDWGLSKMRGQPDVSGGVWQQRIEEYRSASDLQTVAGALGTPGYMAPEAALGISEEVDERSDVYSLGVMLYQILTGELPFRFETFVEYVQATMHEDPRAPTEISPDIPRELSRVAMTALARERSERYTSVDELASHVRRWLTEGSVDREVRFFLDDARAETEAAQRLTGNAALWHLDRATNHCSKILHLRPDHAGAIALKSEILTMRESGIEERVTGSRRQALQKVGVIVLALASIGALVVASALSDARREAEQTVKAAQSREAGARQAAKRDRQRMHESVAQLADGYAAVSDRYLAEGEVINARLAASQGLCLSRTPHLHAALGAADSAWIPTLRRFCELPDPKAITFTPDGETLYVATGSGEIHSIATGSGETKLAWNAPEHAGPITRLAASPDGSQVAFGTPRMIGAFEQGVAEPKYALLNVLKFDSSQPQSDVTALCWHPDGEHVVAGYQHGDLAIWPVGKELVLQEGLHSSAVTAIVVEEAVVFSGDEDGWLTRFMWSPYTPLQRDHLGNEPIRALHVDHSEDGIEIRAFADDLRVRVSLKRMEGNVDLMRPAARPAMEVLPIRRGHELIAGSRDGSIEFWRVADEHRLGVLDGFGARIRGLAIVESRNLLAVARENGRISFWDLSGAVDSPRMPAALLGDDLNRVLRARGDSRVEVRTLSGSRPPKYYLGHQARVTALSAHADGPLAASASLDGSLHAWNPLTGEKRGALKGLTPPVTALSVMPGGTHVVAGTMGGGILIWRWTSPRASRPEPERLEAVSCITTSYDGMRIYAGYVGGAIDVWDVETIRRSATIPPVGALVTQLAVSPDRTRLAIATADDRVLTWDLKQRRRLAEISIPTDATPLALTYSDDGRVSWYSLDGAGWSWTAGAPEARRGPQGDLGFEGAGPTWLVRSPVRRLIDLENGCAARIDGFRVVPMSVAQFRPDVPRIQPWSRLNER